MRDAPAPSELHRQLRMATKLPHHSLDHHPVLAPLLRPDLSVIQYGDALAALHGIYAQAEAWIFDFLAQNPGLFDYRPRRKLPALAADLAALGRSPVRFCGKFSPAPGIGALIGILYTLEGSSQGGQFIARNLRALHDGKLPIEFFSGAGDRSRENWEGFLRFAETACPRSEYAAAADTAAALFRAIRDHLDRALASACS